MLEILSRLHIHTVEGINKNQLEVVNENIEILEELFSDMLKYSSSPKKSKFIDDLLSIFEDILKNLIDMANLSKSSAIISNLYKISTEKNYPLYLDEGLYNFLKFLQEIKEDTTFNKANLNELFYQIYLNVLNNPDAEFEKYISNLYGYMYLQVMKNKHISIEAKRDIITRFIDLVFHYPNKKNTEERNLETNKILEKDNELSIYERLILILIKNSIDMKDEHSFQYIWDAIKENQFLKQISYNKIIFITSLYSYYLSYKEELVNKDDYRQLLSKNMKINDFFYEWDTERVLWDNYKTVNQTLKNWEKMPEKEAKWMVMDKVVKEFYLFYCAAVNPDRVSTFSGLNEVSNILLSYPDIHNDSSLQESYSNFKIFFGFNNNPSINMDELSNVFKKLKILYKKERMDYLTLLNEKIETENSILWSDKNESFNEGSLVKCLLEHIGTNEEIPSIKKVYSQNVPVEFLANDIEKERLIKDIVIRMHDYLDDYIIEEFINRNNDSNSFNIDYMNNEKIELLKKEIDKARSKGINYNYIYTGIKEDALFLYKEAPKNKALYKDIIQCLKLINNPRKRTTWFLYDSDNVIFDLKYLKISYRNLKDQEIENSLEKSKEENGKYCLQLINSITDEFEKNEAYSYFMLSTKVIEIEVELTIEIKEIDSILLIKIQ